VLRSVLNHSTKLVVSTVSSELIFSNNKNFEEADGKVDTKLVSEFCLADAAHPADKVALHASSHIQFGDALHLIHSIVHMRSLSPLEKFLSWVLFCIKLFLSMSNVGKKLSGFKVGTKRVERGVMIGQFMIAFGEVVYDRFNKELRMNNPLFFLKEKEQLVYKLKERRVAHGRNMTLLFTVLVLVGVLVAKRATLALKRLAGRYRALRQLGNLDQFFRVKDIFANDFRCALCMERVRSVIFKPCLHLAVCQACCEKMLERKCPQCQKHVEEVVKVFVS
jgi:Zinc finger, C3HC4 type (RING finger)